MVCGAVDEQRRDIVFCVDCGGRDDELKCWRIAIFVELGVWRHAAKQHDVVVKFGVWRNSDEIVVVTIVVVVIDVVDVVPVKRNYLHEIGANELRCGAEELALLVRRATLFAQHTVSAFSKSRCKNNTYKCFDNNIFARSSTNETQSLLLRACSNKA